MPWYLLNSTCSASEVVRTAIQVLCLFGIVVNPVSIGHFTSLASPQNGHLAPCGVSLALLNGPETVNVFLHFVQVMIFSIRTSILSRAGKALRSLRNLRRGPKGTVIAVGSIAYRST